MNSHMIRELDTAELEIVSGGMDPNYKYCASGPDGAGTYPKYVNCGTATEQYIEAFLNGVEQGKKKGQKA